MIADARYNCASIGSQYVEDVVLTSWFCNKLVTTKVLQEAYQITANSPWVSASSDR